MAITCLCQTRALRAALVFTFVAARLLLALPCGIGANTLCDSSSYGEILCKEDIVAATMEDVEFLHMIQVGSEARQRSLVSLKINNNTTSSNATIVGMLQQQIDANLLAKHLVFKFHTAREMFSSTSAAFGTIMIVFLLIANIIFVSFCFLVYNYSNSENTTKQVSSEWGGPPEVLPQQRHSTVLSPIVSASSRGSGTPKQSPKLENVDPTKICPKLVNSSITTRLALPLTPLDGGDFDVDVLALPGVPVLNLKFGSGDNGLAISLCKTGTLLCLVTTKCRIINEKGTHLGTLMSIGPKQYAMRDRFGHNLVMINPGTEPGTALMVKECDGRITEYAQMFRQKGAVNGPLSAEYYEVVVNPGNDPVLVLACFLALILFALPLQQK